MHVLSVPEREGGISFTGLSLFVSGRATSHHVTFHNLELALQGMTSPERPRERAIADPGPKQDRHRAQWRLPRKFKLIDRASRQPEELEAVEQAVARQHCKTWYMCRGKVPPPPPLHPAVNQLITEWFDVVDDDGSRTLEPIELKAALKAAGIPCNEQTIAEMIQLLDVNRDGVISWDEFRLFMASEIQNGKDLMQGEYVLPSGTTLNFGVMIAKLRRDKLIKEVLEDRSRRGRWAEVASSPRQLAKQLTTMLQATQAAERIKFAQGTVEDAEPCNERNEVVAKMLHSMEAEARIMRSISRQASKFDMTASGRRSPCGQSKSKKQLVGQMTGRLSPSQPSHDRDLAGTGHSAWQGTADSDSGHCSRQPYKGSELSVSLSASRKLPVLVVPKNDATTCVSASGKTRPHKDRHI